MTKPFWGYFPQGAFSSPDREDPLQGAEGDPDKSGNTFADNVLKEAGLRLRYVNFERDPGARPTLDGYDGLVVLGGPMNVDQTEEFPFLATEVELVGEAVARDLHRLVHAEEMGELFKVMALGGGGWPAGAGFGPV